MLEKYDEFKSQALIQMIELYRQRAFGVLCQMCLLRYQNIGPSLFR